MRVFLMLLIFVPAAFAQYDLEGIDGAALNNLMEDAGKTNSDAVVIYRGERRVGVWTFGKETVPLDAMSATQGIAALAVGLLLADGKLASLDVPVADFYPEWKDGDKAGITVRHILAHTSGLASKLKADSDPAVVEDLIVHALGAEVGLPPDEVFFQNPRAINLIGGIVAKATGKPMDAYLAERVFGPMGIESAVWSRDAAGNIITMTGLKILPEDLAKIGVLCLQKGRWQDEQLIPASWFETMFASPAPSAPSTGLSWYRIYGKTIYVIDEALLQTYRDADVDPAFIEGMSRLQGRYTGRTAVMAMFIGSFGKNWRQSINKYLSGKNLQITNREYEDLMGYNTSGREGQWLVIFPEKQLVGVRMVAPETMAEDESNIYNNFGDLLRQLVSEAP